MVKIYDNFTQIINQNMQQGSLAKLESLNTFVFYITSPFFNDFNVNPELEKELTNYIFSSINIDLLRKTVYRHGNRRRIKKLTERERYSSLILKKIIIKSF